MNKKIILFPLLIIFALSSCSREPLLTLQGSTMGTWYTVKVSGVDSEYDQDRIEMAVNTALTKVNHSLNTYDPDSEISRFNAYNKPGAFPLSEGFMLVSRTAERIYKESNGAFDPTVKELVRLWGFGDNGLSKKPDAEALEGAMKHVGLYKLHLTDIGITKNDPDLQLDYSAIAKGYGVDIVMEELVMLGYKNILVEIGGEIRAKGTRNGKPWRIGIAIPDENNIGNQRSSETIILNNMSCATSGDYQQFYEEEGERYSHLIDPKTGYPIKHDVTSVTVVAKNCMLADAAATAAIVLGKTKGLEFIESLEGVEAFFIYRDGDFLNSVHTSGWKW
ncbi:MAG: FAD:protein FMN transferase [Candidatus Marinimicrobia bacterium]|nr:FAD:protein FMN transferase [Candidatus Neomarinimicrobiota bacterium]